MTTGFPGFLRDIHEEYKAETTNFVQDLVAMAKTCKGTQSRLFHPYVIDDMLIRRQDRDVEFPNNTVLDCRPRH